ncbi:MAG: vitamin B12-dependent ribonucleotide reductase, partial [Deltaproteobacteria bacterium]|nr:vitamin B12-dependent ribonucleotide reductase [Deltaproteobacteria bacterium]
MEPTITTTSKKSSTSHATGLTYKRAFSKADIHPFDDVEWEMRSATITNENGDVVFSQENVEIPAFWSQMATNVVVSKYFRGALGSIERENSVKQLISRVSQTISLWAQKGDYFQTKAELEAFEDDLTYLLLHQMMAFNSPVWFNVGIEDHPQCSACFINSVEDNMSSILDLAKTEGMLFKGGSGSGTNLSSIRSSKETLTGGGNASGPVSFMKGYDAFAGVIKSGGKTRRAAKMVILDVDHPDIQEFIDCKKEEEKKAWALIDAGYDGSFTGEAYASVFFQNSNNSVRVSDKFMQAAQDQSTWSTKAVRDGKTVETLQAEDLLTQIADAAWFCGDPGIQFDDTINKWHTCAQTDRIYGSNPCSEYMFLNDTACNLASLNLMKFQTPEGQFNIEAFQNACKTTILAQEILVDNASYPTAKIETNSHIYRPLGLGYANLGALLMSKGLPYDSEQGRAYAAAITAVMTGHAYLTSSQIAASRGAFAGYAQNRESMLKVIRQHADAVYTMDKDLLDPALFEAAAQNWEKAFELGKKVGFRNAQVSVLAPTGTIAFMMDCDTTGIEPDIALVKYKKMVGDGYIKMVNRTVPMALKNLGYTMDEVSDITAYIDEHETIEGCTLVKEDHLAVFDCAIKPAHGHRFIGPMGHINMMAATQAFLSGAISKTVNLPHEITPDEITRIYMQAWKKGLKAIAIYRDGCKRSQPLNTSATN